MQIGAHRGWDTFNYDDGQVTRNKASRDGIQPIAKLFFVPQMGKAGEQLAQRIQQDLADGTAFVSPPIDVDKDQVASLTTGALTQDH